MSQMPPTVAIITHPSQNNTLDAVRLQVDIRLSTSYQKTRAVVDQWLKDESAIA